MKGRGARRQNKQCDFQSEPLSTADISSFSELRNAYTGRDGAPDYTRITVKMNPDYITQASHQRLVLLRKLRCAPVTTLMLCRFSTQIDLERLYLLRPCIPLRQACWKSFDAGMQSQAEQRDAQPLCDAVEQPQRAVLESLATGKRRQQTQLTRAFRKQYLCDRRALSPAVLPVRVHSNTRNNRGGAGTPAMCTLCGKPRKGTHGRTGCPFGEPSS